MRKIMSMHWKNINPNIIADQKAVIQHLGYEITQVEADRVSHGDWMNWQLEKAEDNAVFLFLDIDAIPLNREIIERAFAAAENGEVFGVAQTANHLPDRNYVYAAPSFLAFTKATWEKTERTSMMHTDFEDVAMAFTKSSRDLNIPVKTLFPIFACLPVWPVANHGHSGIATFYEGGVFHLFQSRMNQGYDYAFHAVAQAVIAGSPIDHIALRQHLNSFSVRWFNRKTVLLQRFRRIILRIFKKINRIHIILK